MEPTRRDQAVEWLCQHWSLGLHEKLLDGQRWQHRSIVMVEKPAIFTSNFQSFLPHWFLPVPQNSQKCWPTTVISILKKFPLHISFESNNCPYLKKKQIRTDRKTATGSRWSTKPRLSSNGHHVILNRAYMHSPWTLKQPLYITFGCTFTGASEHLQLLYTKCLKTSCHVVWLNTVRA